MNSNQSIIISFYHILRYLNLLLIAFHISISILSCNIRDFFIYNNYFIAGFRDFIICSLVVFSLNIVLLDQTYMGTRFVLRKPHPPSSIISEALVAESTSDVKVPLVILCYTAIIKVKVTE